jgi:hypothetical protein
MKYSYEISDENGQSIACGECDHHTAEAAIELIYNEIIEPESTVIEILQDKQEYKCWCYDATVEHADSIETVTITIK